MAPIIEACDLVKRFDGFTAVDHISFAVGSRADLEAWEQNFSSKSVAFSPIVDAPYGAVLSFKDPDGIALEAFAPATG